MTGEVWDALMGMPVCLALIAGPLFWALMLRWVGGDHRLAQLGAVLWLAGVAAWWLDGPSHEGVVVFSIAGLPLSVGGDSLGASMLLMVAVLWVVTSFYTESYASMHALEDRHCFYGWIYLTLAGMACLVSARSFLTLYLAYEWITWSTYPLVRFGHASGSLAGGLHYVRGLWWPSLGLLLPVALGSESWLRIDPSWLGWLMVAWTLGCAKAPWFPAHGWIVSAMVAPTPVSALLHAVAVVNAGVFAILRGYQWMAETVGSTAGHAPAWVVLLWCLMTIHYAGWQAWRQSLLKPTLAFSTIMHMAYATMIVATGHPNGPSCAVVYLCAHGCAKIGLFFMVGMLRKERGAVPRQALVGLGYEHRILAVLWLLASLSLLAMPPFLGYAAKAWVMHHAVTDATVGWMVAAVLSSTFWTAIFFLRSVADIFAPIDQAWKQRSDPWHRPTPLGLMAVGSTVAMVVIGGALL